MVLNDKRITLGSLFDGIGGFPLCAVISGIEPIWAAEIEPTCIVVAKQHFPNMQHYGDVSKINGGKIPPVDIITFGSPCQDLSIAGNRAGLDGKRSGLFSEAIRIIYEMREATDGRYPTFIVWENVPGAFSSHNGHDFQTVLKEITKTDISMPASGKWANAGVVRGGRICAAWRVLDAQYWGVPQRRKRIYIIGSFGSNSAEEILFKPDSVQRYLAPSRTQGQEIAADTGGGVKCSNYIFDCRGNGNGSTAPTITGDHNSRVTDYSAVVLQSSGFIDRASKDAYSIGYESEKAPTLRAEMTPSVILQSAGFHGQNSIIAAGVELNNEQCPTLTTKKNADVIYNVQGFPLGFRPENVRLYDDKATTLCSGTRPGFCNGVVYSLQGSMIGREDKNGPQGDEINEDLSFTLNVTDRHSVVYALDRASFNQGKNAKYDFEITDSGINSTLIAKGPSAVAYEAEIEKMIEWIVRRLTPLECERLQGYSDNWTVLKKIEDMTDEEYEFFKEVYLLDKRVRGKEIKKIPNRKQLTKWYNKLDSDSTRYKQLGNSLAIPCALRVVGYIADYIRNNW